MSTRQSSIVTYLSGTCEPKAPPVEVFFTRPFYHSERRRVAIIIFNAYPYFQNDFLLAQYHLILPLLQALEGPPAESEAGLFFGV
jgi:hypothetical protein